MGLVSGACFADFGHRLVCVDKDFLKIEALKRGEIPIYEPSLQDLVGSNVQEGRLSFATRSKKPFVPPTRYSSQSAHRRDGVTGMQISPSLRCSPRNRSSARRFTVIISKSTVPVGTSDEVEIIIHEAQSDADVVVVSNPEFLREGAAIHDFKHPDRIVVGTDDERAKKVVNEIYRPLNLNQAPLLYTTRRTAG